MYQSRSSAGPRIIATPLLTRLLWHSFVAMPCCSRRCPWIVLENVLRSHVYWRQYPCMPLVIMRSMVVRRLYSPVIPCTFWLITWHACGQVSLDLYCTWECDSLRGSAAGVSPYWSSPSVSGKYSLSCDGVSHGAGWECRFLFVGEGRRGRRRSTKGATG